MIALNTLFQTAVRERPRGPRILGYALALVCLVWVLRDFHIVRALQDIAKVNWKWVLVGMSFDVISYGIQGLRWKFLLTPFGKVRLTSAIRAVYAGIFANLVFPLRPGEFLRSYLLSNSEGVTLGRVLGSVGVERLVGLIAQAAHAPTPRRPTKPTYASRQRRLEDKKKRGEVKTMRTRPLD